MAMVQHLRDNNDLRSMMCSTRLYQTLPRLACLGSFSHNYVICSAQRSAGIVNVECTLSLATASVSCNASTTGASRPVLSKSIEWNMPPDFFYLRVKAVNSAIHLTTTIRGATCFLRRASTG